MIKQTILKWVLHWVWFMLTIWVFVIWYAAWVNLSNVTSSDTLTATWWNNVINNINDLNTRLTNNFSNVDNTRDNTKNVLSATKLTTPRTINWISFDWSSDITIPTWGSIPSWAIMAFYLTTCPSWWKAADGTSLTPDLRWAFIRWLNWNLNSRDVSRTLWEYQSDLIKSTSFNGSTTISKVTPWECWYATWFEYINNNQRVCSSWNHTISISWTIWSWNDTRPKNIALLYCMKE